MTQSKQPNMPKTIKDLIELTNCTVDKVKFEKVVLQAIINIRETYPNAKYLTADSDGTFSLFETLPVFKLRLPSKTEVLNTDNGSWVPDFSKENTTPKDQHFIARRSLFLPFARIAIVDVSYLDKKESKEEDASEKNAKAFLKDLQILLNAHARLLPSDKSKLFGAIDEDGTINIFCRQHPVRRCDRWSANPALVRHEESETPYHIILGNVFQELKDFDYTVYITTHNKVKDWDKYVLTPNSYGEEPLNVANKCVEVFMTDLCETAKDLQNVLPDTLLEKCKDIAIQVTVGDKNNIPTLLLHLDNERILEIKPQFRYYWNANTETLSGEFI